MTLYHRLRDEQKDCILVIVMFNDKKIEETSDTEKKGPEAVLHY